MQKKKKFYRHEGNEANDLWSPVSTVTWPPLFATTTNFESRDWVGCGGP